MRLLFDHNVPAPLRRALPEHDVTFADEQGWAAISNGALIAAAERAGFDVLLTADQNIRYQQNLSGRRMALVVLSTNNWNHLAGHIEAIRMLIADAAPGSYRALDLPKPARVRHPPPGPPDP